MSLSKRELLFTGNSNSQERGKPHTGHLKSVWQERVAESDTHAKKEAEVDEAL